MSSPRFRFHTQFLKELFYFSNVPKNMVERELKLICLHGYVQNVELNTQVDAASILFRIWSTERQA